MRRPREFTSLDDLLSTDARGRRLPRRRRLWLLGILARATAIAVAVSGAAYGLGVLLFGVSIPYALALVVVLAIALGRDVVVSLQAPLEMAEPVRESGELPNYALPDRPFRQVRRWEARLEWITGDPDRFTNVVMPSLVEIVDERLRLRHGISRVADRERAREIMGPRLWAFVHSMRPDKVPSSRELAVIVKELEEL